MIESDVGERYIVIDDFLDEDFFETLAAEVLDVNYTAMPSVVDPVVDGDALRSRGVALPHDDACPASGPRSAVYRAILDEVLARPDFFGRPPEAWSRLTFAFWRYAAGARLGWHNDALAGRTGEFILYLHRDWDLRWAGELVLLDGEPPEDLGSNALERLPRAVRDTARSLTAIPPLPNRLVLMRSGTPHYVNRVDLAASDSVRSTLTGFASKV